jgi:uncharacterized delta-60 repeat protein
MTHVFLAFVLCFLGNEAAVPAELVGTFSAASGSLDTTFDLDGRVTTRIPGSGDYAHAQAVAIQPDGKIVAAGWSAQLTGAAQMTLVRFNPDGSLDPTFGGDGIVTTPVAGTHARAFAVAIQPDGKIVAVGDIGPPMGVVRYNPDGSLDTTFDGDGIRTIVIYNNDLAYAVAIQADGKIIVGGYGEAPFSPKNLTASWKKLLPEGHTTDFALARVNSDGSLDRTFGNEGKVVTNIILGEVMFSLALQPDGKIVAAGGTVSYEGGGGALVRYNLNGSLDTSFGDNGIVVTDGSSSYNGVAVEPGGGIVVAGGGKGMSAARFKSNGTFDPSFGDAGRALIEFKDHPSIAYSVALQNDGGIVLAGKTFGGDETGTFDVDFAVARLTDRGLADLRFGNGGKLTTDFGGTEAAVATAIQRDGRIVAAGYGDQGFTLARYVGLDPPVRADFDGDGRTDISVFRPSEGNWYLNRSRDNIAVMTWGFGTDIPAPADYDGDRRADIAVFRPTASGPTFYIVESGSGAFVSFAWGVPGDVPVPADYDGDGRDDAAVFRPSENRWYIRGSRDGYVVQEFGQAGDVPVRGDFDGDGRTDISVYRGGQWWIKFSSAGVSLFNWGFATDKPVVGDYDGDGTDDIAVYRPSEANWYIRTVDGRFLPTVHWGAAADVPVPGDYDGDRRADPAVYRDGIWYTNGSRDGFAVTGWGVATDVPLPSRY